MADESKSYRDVISRRRFAELAGVSGAAALAGCDGNTDTDTESSPADQGTTSDGDGTETSGSGSTSVQDVTLVSAEDSDTATMGFNNYSSPTDWSIRLIFDRFVQYYFHKAEFKNYAISEWNVSGKEMTLKVRDGLKWHDGDDVTSQDLKAKFDVELATGQAISNHIDSVETDGDQTVVATLTSAKNPLILKHALNGRRLSMDVKYSEFKDILDQGDDTISEEFANMTRREPIGTGPFKIAEINQEHLLLERFDQHPDADLINFENVEYVNFGGNSKMQQALIGGQTDTVHSLFTPSNIVDQMPNSVVEAQPAAKLGFGLLPQHDDEDMGKRGVRQAIMAALDRKSITDSYPRVKNPVEVPAGLPNQEIDRFLGDQKDTYETYGDSAKVAQYLEEEGYSKDGGTWKNSNGKALTVPIKVPGGWSDFIAQVQIAVDQLQSAGFEASVASTPGGEMQSNVWPNGDYKICAAMWSPGGGQATFPYYAFEYMIDNSHWPMQGSENYPGDETKTFPSRTGSGEVEINPQQEYQKLSGQISSEKSTTITRNVAWAINQDLPFLQITEKAEQAFLTEDDTWSVPESGASIYKTRWPVTWLPHVGEISAKTQ